MTCNHSECIAIHHFQNNRCFSVCKGLALLAEYLGAKDTWAALIAKRSSPDVSQPAAQIVGFFLQERL
jgi:hypothetical protein